MKIEYVIISPVRNEEDYVERTIKSVLQQTILPSEWILVNDGSTDRTVEIIQFYADKYSWIKLINLPDKGYYLPGKGVVNAFYKGYESLLFRDWNFLIKLDCDISFDANYFEELLIKFSENEKLGIASGWIYNVINGKLYKEKSHEDQPFGASKMYRRECFLDIGGIKRIPGWDLADVLGAQMNGWETRCYSDKVISHYRRGGSRSTGLTSGKFLQGRLQYRFGYGLLYTFLKSIYHLTSRPYIINGVCLITGYLFAFVSREKRYFDNKMIKYLRKRQNVFLFSRIKRFFVR